MAVANAVRGRAGGAFRHQSGLAAEEAISREYQATGGQVLAMRKRTDAGEIDLIVEAQSEIVFVEVKARRTHDAALRAVSARQRARLMSAAECWLEETGRGPLTPCRFDVVAIDAQGATHRVENAFAL